MASENRAAWGIDIGQAGLKAVKLRYAESSGQAVAVAFDYVPHPKILSQPDAIPEELIPQAIETFLSRNDIDGDDIAISVPGKQSLARFIQLPPVEKSKVAEIVKYEAKQQIPFPLEEVIWDFQPLGNGEEEGGYLLDAEVGLFAMKRQEVYDKLNLWQDRKVEIELIQTAPVALYNMLVYDEMGWRPGQEVPGGDEYYIILDMGCDDTTLIISNGSKIWIRSVNLGGNHFTRALVKDMKLSFAKADHLKCNATKAPDPKSVFQALRPVFNDYVSEIQRSIGFFSGTNRNAQITKVFGLGNGFKLAGLQKYLQQNLDYEVVRPETFPGLTGDAVLNSPLFQENLLTFPVSYGLALQALNAGKMTTTLLPPEIATAREVRKKKPWAVAAAATILAGVSISMAGNQQNYSYVVGNEEFAKAISEKQALDSKFSGFDSTYGAAKSSFETAKTVAPSLVEGRRDLTWLELYDSVNATLPRDVGVALDESDIQKKNQLSIQAITCRHMSDVGTWFTELKPDQLEFMDLQYRPIPEGKESDRTPLPAPAGEGYVFTVTGTHWHHGESLEMQGAEYVLNTMIKNLAEWQVDAGGRTHDVGRMGISHPVLTYHLPEKITYYENGRKGSTSGESRILRGRRPGPRVPAGQPGADGEGREIPQTKFRVEFAWVPVADADRPETDPNAPAAAEGEAAATEETPSEA